MNTTTKTLTTTNIPMSEIISLLKLKGEFDIARVNMKDELVITMVTKQ